MIKKTNRRKYRKGSVLLEFTLIIPMAILFILFSIDVGRYVIYQTNLKESVAVAARNSARVGYAGNWPGSYNCGTAGSDSNIAFSSFCKSLSSVPGGIAKVDYFNVINPTGTGLSGTVLHACSNTGNEKFVVVEAKIRVIYISPLIKILLIANPDFNTIYSKSVSFCEVGFNE